MKRFSLLSLLALVFAVVYACSDSTAPANSNGLLAPKNAVLGFFGDPPPPPVDAGITMTISSHVVLHGSFDGVYFANGKTAWLRLDNSQSRRLETSASANARFKKSDDRLSGMGTLLIEGHRVTIEDVTFFFANQDCGITGETCATIEFDATVDGISGHHGRAHAFDRRTCQFFPPGDGFPPGYSCGEE